MLCGNASRKAVRPSKGDVTRLDPTGHIMCLGCRVDDLINGLHGEVEGHEFALGIIVSAYTDGWWQSWGNSEHTTGCKPANAAPTVRPAKPDSVIGLSMTLFSPNRSSSPLVTLYLFQASEEPSLQSFGRTPTLHCTGRPLRRVRRPCRSIRAPPRELRSGHL